MKIGIKKSKASEMKFTSTADALLPISQFSREKLRQPKNSFQQLELSPLVFSSRPT